MVYKKIKNHITKSEFVLYTEYYNKFQNILIKYCVILFVNVKQFNLNNLLKTFYFILQPKATHDMIHRIVQPSLFI